jgi:hypothetical protein
MTAGDRVVWSFAAVEKASVACVMGQTLRAGRRTWRAIHSQWRVTDRWGRSWGQKKPAGLGGYGKYDKGDTDKMANPDNLKYLERFGTLFIGEDSGNRMNNFLWALPVPTPRR